MIKLLTLFLYLLHTTSSVAITLQEINEGVILVDTLATESREIIKYDSSFVEKVTFNKATVQKYKADEAFNYNEVDPEENIWTQFKAWLSNLWNSFLNRILGVDEAVGFLALIIKLLPYIGMITLIALLIWIFTKIDSGTLLGEKIKAPSVLLSDDEELINNQNLESLIQLAISQRNYRLAIRYYYLRTLQLMSSKDLINWQVQKTNNDYLIEIQDSKTRVDFKQITELYDYIWYGNFEVDETAFAKAETPFKTLQATL